MHTHPDRPTESGPKRAEPSCFCEYMYAAHSPNLAFDRFLNPFFPRLTFRQLKSIVLLRARTRCFYLTSSIRIAWKPKSHPIARHTLARLQPRSLRIALYCNNNNTLSLYNKVCRSQ